MLKAVQSCIQEENDEVQFRNSSGVSVESFLELLSMYLKATVVTWGEKRLIQRNGVCIGSKIAPVLSNIFLSGVDRVVRDALRGVADSVFRYVDDYS